MHTEPLPGIWTELSFWHSGALRRPSNAEPSPWHVARTAIILTVRDLLIIAEQSATESATGARMKIDFHDVEATLLAPLCARAKFSREFPSIFNDAKAIELVDQIDYDFSTKVAALGLEGTIAIVARAKQFDDKIRAYVNEHQQASVINVGAGLDATFYRVDNGLLQWYDLDLPNVIDTRRRLALKKTEQRTSQGRFSTRGGARASETKKTACSC